MTDRLLTVSFGGSNLAAITDVQSLSWPEFAARLTTTPPETDDKASVGWYIAAEFSSMRRHGDSLVSRHALALDYDVVTPEQVALILGSFSELANACYTTWSHTPEAPRIRVVLPLSRPATGLEFCAVSRHVASWAGIDLCAAESFVDTQMMFMPTRKAGAEFRGRVRPGAFVDVDAILATYEDWTDKTSWPRRAKGDDVHNGEASTPPGEKPGLVGLWCRTFNCEEAIARFDLPYERVR